MTQVRMRGLKSKTSNSATETFLRAVNAWMAEKNCTFIQAFRELARQQPELWAQHKAGLKPAEPDLRERFAMKAKARAYLLRIVAFLDRCGPRENRFEISHQPARVMTALQRVVVFPDAPFDKVSGVMATLAVTAFRILQTMARDEPVRNADLDVLTKILNQHQDPIRFRPVLLADPSPMYRRKGGMEVSFIDDLLSYMDLAARYGREHHPCGMQGCDSLMISGRGGKRFCSPVCRNKFWSYSRQKEYYLDRREQQEQGLAKKRRSSPGTKSSTKRPARTPHQ